MCVCTGGFGEERDAGGERRGGGFHCISPILFLKLGDGCLFSKPLKFIHLAPLKYLTGPKKAMLLNKI